MKSRESITVPGTEAPGSNLAIMKLVESTENDRLMLADF
jgi:hypothetical protein